MKQSALQPRDWFDIAAFVAVVEEGGFGAGARAMRTSAPSMSRAVQRLETRLGVRLLHRTTRAMSLTEVGRVYLQEVSQGLHALDAAEKQATLGEGNARGVLKVTLPATFGRHVIAPLLPAFLRAYPAIEMDARFSEYAVDIVAEGIDVGIRMGKPMKGGLLISKFARTRRVACASPEYLANHAAPTRPEEIRAHRCLSYRRHGTDGWGFQVGRRETTVTPNSILRADCGEALLEAARAGLGIAYVPWFLVADDVECGRLVVVLESFETRSAWLYAAYTDAVRRAPKVQAFVAFLRSALAGGLY